MQPHRRNFPPIAKREVIYLMGYMSHMKVRSSRTKKWKVGHAEILTASLHKVQLGAHEAVTSNTIISHYKKLTNLERRNPNANSRQQIVVKNPMAQRLCNSKDTLLVMT